MSAASLTDRTERIFLTGATGYLGIHLLAALLNQSNAQVRCLVRASNKAQALSRLYEGLAAQGLNPQGIEQRLEVSVGDLAAPALGLTPGEYARLGEEVDLIIHNGAQVNYVLNYAQLRPANVDSTQALLRVAQRKGIPLAYISTLRLFDSRTDGVPIRETDAVDEQATRYSGYSRSKWMSEKLIHNAARRGQPCCILRPGLICAGREYPNANPHDAVSRLIKGCLELGATPDSALQVNLTPVDYVVNGIVALLRQPQPSGVTYHLVNDTATGFNRIAELLQDRGYDLTALPYLTWRQKLEQCAARGNNALLPLMAYFTDDLPEQSQRRVFDSRRTQQCLARMGVSAEPLDATLLRHTIDSLIRQESIPEPSLSSSDEPPLQSPGKDTELHYGNP
ncbi:thioester reductase domain-containing protein [Marinimicrobium locisalis]|uniref:thioester reductase domain-containing protein n=1 Tax=Marinimicrobium locisalis TaxID=546022 RepID=UPI003221F005